MVAKYYQVNPKGPLKGDICLSGAKNAATKEIVASLLTKEECILENVPQIDDVKLTLDMCSGFGTEFDFKKGKLKIKTKKIGRPSVDKSYTGRNRIPILMIGPLLHRYGEAHIPIVGGDKIGKRPVNFHFLALEKMGAEVSRKGVIYSVKAKKLYGAEIILPFPSVGATENILLSSVLAEGRTVLKNAAIEPEIVDLVMVLQKMGAIIGMKENRTYVVDGIKKLRGYKHRVIPDRIEAASFACAAIASKGDIFVKEARQRDMVTFLNKIRLVGCLLPIRKS